MIQFGELVAVANTSLALLAVSRSCGSTRGSCPCSSSPLVAVFLAYRAYVSEREKHERLELLYQSSRILQHSPELDSALGALLEHAREMFRAERAEILLWPRDGGAEGLLTAREPGRRPTGPWSPCRPAVATRSTDRVGHDAAGVPPPGLGRTMSSASATRWSRRCSASPG